MSEWQIGDRVRVATDLKKELHDFEALITGIGHSYMRLDYKGETRACYPKDAVLIKSADGSKEQQNLLTKKRGGARPGSGRRAGTVSPWINAPTKAIRVPEKFADDLLAIAQQMDWGEWSQSASDETDRAPGAGKLDQLKELLQRWNAEAVGKRAKYDRSWGKALVLLAELNEILTDD